MLRRGARLLPGAPDPWSLALATAPGAQRLLWHDPAGDLTFAALGRAHRFVVAGADRAASAAFALRDQLAGLQVVDTDDLEALDSLPLAIGELAFDPAGAGWPGWPAAELVVPQVLVVRRGGRTHWITTHCTHAAQVPTTATPAPARTPRTHDDLEALVRAAAERAADPGDPLTKVVVARATDLAAPDGHHFDAPATLRALRERHGDCIAFSVERGNGECFVGATPETLVRVESGRLETMALAGTRARTGHDDAGERARVLDSAHLRREQRLVTDAIVEALAPLCQQVEADAAPTVRTLRTLHHLQSEVRGRLRDDAHVLDAVAALHPTPAVGGWPRAAALDWIRDHEGLARGAYAAPLGWVDARGGGHFAVALRCMLLGAERRTARVYAGAGIIAGADPAAERAEIEAKARSVAAHLETREAAR